MRLVRRGGPESDPQRPEPDRWQRCAGLLLAWSAKSDGSFGYMASPYGFDPIDPDGFPGGAAA